MTSDIENPIGTKRVHGGRRVTETRMPAKAPPEAPPVVGWTHPVKPVWVHDLLDLWERNKLLTQYLELATDRIAQDIYSARTRRRVLFQIARCFVPQTGSGRRSRTTSPNPWAAYSQLYRAHPLAPAYLVHLVAANTLVNATASLLHRDYAVGDTILLRDIRGRLVDRIGDRPSVRAGASSVLRTYAHFGVLARPGRAGEYRYAAQLAVDVDTFPLLVWAWWRARKRDVIHIPGLADDPLLTFIEHGSYAGHWAEYEGSLWRLETRDGVECAVLRHTDNGAFIRTLFNLLSSHPKWPTVNRQFPDK